MTRNELLKERTDDLFRRLIQRRLPVKHVFNSCIVLDHGKNDGKCIEIYPQVERDPKNGDEFGEFELALIEVRTYEYEEDEVTRLTEGEHKLVEIKRFEGWRPDEVIAFVEGFEE